MPWAVVGVEDILEWRGELEGGGRGGGWVGLGGNGMELLGSRVGTAQIIGRVCEEEDLSFQIEIC